MALWSFILLKPLHRILYLQELPLQVSQWSKHTKHTHTILLSTKIAREQSTLEITLGHKINIGNLIIKDKHDGK